MRRRDVVAAAAGAVVATVLAGSVAWAAIPGDGGVYSACMLKNVGTVRLIDKSLPPGNFMSHCKPALEVEIAWNQQGLQGLPGAPGATGADGSDGDPFSGTFTSPNGEYSISVANDGITLAHGTDASIRLTGSNITVESGDALQVDAGGDVTMDAGGAFATQSGTNTTLESGNALTLQSASSATVQTTGSLSLAASQIRLNAGGACPAAARAGDTVIAGSIVTGSTTVCIG